jgi:hypothetical protein
MEFVDDLVKYSFGRGVPNTSYANPVATNNHPDTKSDGL